MSFSFDFVKMNGAGNDFVMLDNRHGQLNLTREQIHFLCDRHRGIGADGLLMLELTVDEVPYRMRYYNADGLEVEMCGNGARCFTRYIAELEQLSGEIIFQTKAGIVKGIHQVSNEVQILMTSPFDVQLNQSLQIDSSKQYLKFHTINTGVPHVIIFVDDLTSIFHYYWNKKVVKADEAIQKKSFDKGLHDASCEHPSALYPVVVEMGQMPKLSSIDITELGRKIRYHDHFKPAGTNVNFVQVEEQQLLKIRTYERGVEDETMACGTGVTAAALIHHFLSHSPSPISVLTQGGNELKVNFQTTEKLLQLQNVTLTGPADFVFKGTISI